MNLMKKVLYLLVISLSVACGKHTLPTTTTAPKSQEVKAGTKAPVIGDITFKMVDGTLVVNADVKDEDSKEVKVNFVHFEKSNAPTDAAVDWKLAKSPEKDGSYKITGPEVGKTYKVFVKATDEAGNSVVKSEIYEVKAPEVATKKKPEIKKVTIAPDGTSLVAKAEITAGDSKQIKIFFIHFEKNDKTPAQKDIDWTKAKEVAKNEAYRIENVVKGTRYIVYAKIVDEDKNEAVSSQELTVGEVQKSSALSTLESGATGLANPGTTQLTQLDLTKAAEEDIGNLKEFVRNLCDQNLELIKSMNKPLRDQVESFYTDLCEYDFSIATPKFPPTNTEKKPYPAEYIVSVEKIVLQMGIQQIPDSIGKLTKLKKLDLQRNLLGHVPETLAQLTNLEELDLSYNALKEIPSYIEKFEKLTVLSINDNQPTKFPDFVENLKNLKNLNIKQMELKSFPNSITNLSNLEELDFSCNMLKVWPEDLKKLTKLQKLDASCNSFAILPNSLAEMTSLKELSLQENTEIITKIPSNMENLKGSLNKLDLTKAKISSANKAKLKSIFGDKVVVFETPKK